MGTGTPATPTITVDMVLFKQHGTTHCLLLIQRRDPPYQGCWALPGGNLDSGESVEQAAARELGKETGITGVVLHQYRVFSEPGRDPRGHYISVAFYGFAEHTAEAGAAAWFDIAQLPHLAFDHEHIIHEALRVAYPGSALMSRRHSSLATVRTINAAIRANEQGCGKAVYAIKNGAKIRITRARTRRERTLPGVLQVYGPADGHWFTPDSIVQE